MVKVQLNGVSNPGWYFTVVRLQQLNQLYEWIINNFEEEFTYKEIQNRIESDNKILDGSKIRMFFPWLKRYGLFEYTNKLIVISDLLTPLGEQFFVFNKIYLELYKTKDEKIKGTLNKILEDFLCQFFINLLTSDKSLIYKKCVDYINNNQELNFNQFHILTNSIEENKSEEWVNEMIKLENKDDLHVEIKKNPNSWKYNMELLSNAGLIYFDKNKIYPTEKFSKVMGGYEDVI
ncbi:hypothetical protein [Mammaliicoccus sp. G-M28]|uniref:hypothetical protein n=1 Tax=Mammaliicoccus sp. G-M28 TaxID=2898688 RepID=UPI001EFA2F0D|nr:hypothetical protein [Mammaliicoccus sp. G-M28]